MGISNRDWLFSLPLEEQIAWMESEHYEPNPDCSAMLYRMFTENMKHEPCNGYEPKNDVDSRELLEADVREWIDIATYKKFTPERMLEVMLHWLDRQAAITDREWEAEQSYLNAGYKEQVDELKAERDRLKSRICELEDDLVRANDERDNWKANCEDWKKHARAAENACYETVLEREEYRKLFGMALDWAHEITMLESSVDEGMA